MTAIYLSRAQINGTQWDTHVSVSIRGVHRVGGLSPPDSRVFFFLFKGFCFFFQKFLTFLKKNFVSFFKSFSTFSKALFFFSKVPNFQKVLFQK